MRRPSDPPLGVHSLSLERKTSTGVLANFSREFANFKRELTNLKRELAKFERELANHKPKLSEFEPSLPGFAQLTQEITGIDLQF